MRKTLITLAMCVTLALSSLSTVCAASQGSAPASTTDEQKSYVEGEALAIVRGGEQLQGPGRTERIAQVSARAFQDVLEEWDGSGSGAAVTNRDKYCSDKKERAAVRRGRVLYHLERQ